MCLKERYTDIAQGHCRCLGHVQESRSADPALNKEAVLALRSALEPNRRPHC